MATLRKTLTTIDPEEGSFVYFRKITAAERIIHRKWKARCLADVVGQLLYAGAVSVFVLSQLFAVDLTGVDIAGVFVRFYSGAKEAAQALTLMCPYILPTLLLLPVAMPLLIFGCSLLLPVGKPLNVELDEAEYARLNAQSVSAARKDYYKLGTKIPVWPYTTAGCAVGFGLFIYECTSVFTANWFFYCFLFVVMLIVYAVISRAYCVFWKYLGYNRGTELLLSELSRRICELWPKRDPREQARLDAEEKARQERKNKQLKLK